MVVSIKIWFLFAKDNAEYSNIGIFIYYRFTLFAVFMYYSWKQFLLFAKIRNFFGRKRRGKKKKAKEKGRKSQGIGLVSASALMRRFPIFFPDMLTSRGKVSFVFGILRLRIIFPSSSFPSSRVTVRAPRTSFIDFREPSTISYRFIRLYFGFNARPSILPSKKKLINQSTSALGNAPHIQKTKLTKKK